MEPALILSGVGLLLVATTTGAGMAWRNSAVKLNGTRESQQRLEAGQIRLENKMDARFDSIDGRVRQTETDIAEMRAEI